ncbi:MAG TPA: tetratricopeptide repeat protein [Steroidobacteraceae bacterium]|nr:tetratricopeptide repeat protein [Steroidobacteraceae bacterium]
MPDMTATLQRALALHTQGQAAQAESLYRTVLRTDPKCITALQNLGTALLDQGRAEPALAVLDEALGLDANLPIALNSRGNALALLGRHAQALASFEAALRLDPVYARAFSNRCEPLLALGRPAEALASAEEALRLKPLPVAASNRGKALMALGRVQDALTAFDQALALRPNWPLALANRSQALLELGRAEEARRDAEAALQQAPYDPHALNARGSALRALRRLPEAVHAYDAARELAPGMALLHYNCGQVRLDLRQPQAALADFERALERSPEWGEAHLARGTALLLLRRLPEAAAALDRAADLKPDLPLARGQALHARLQQADWRLYDDGAAAVLAAVDRGVAADEPLSFLALTGSAVAQLTCGRATAARVPAAIAPEREVPGPRTGRIRIAYLSSDFGEHPVSYLLTGVLEHHDRARFEVSALSLRAPDQGPYGRRIQGAVDRFLEVGGRSDADIARLIRALEVDVLVDLMGYTQGTRLPVLASRAACVQVGWLGYPGTLGARFMDYLIADEFVVPLEAEAHYAERIVRLPCFQPNDEQRVLPGPASRAQAGLPAQGFVFCCLNATYKLNPPLFDVWCRILAQCPHSVLWLLGEEEATRENLRREAAARRVSPERLVFAPRCDYPSHLARLQQADLFLDTQPFSAGTTASDALWAGVPVITCPGEAFAARMAGSLLRAVGLPQLITGSLQEYERLAVSLAGDATTLQQLKAHLHEARAGSALFDSGSFCRNLEAAYRRMHQRALEGAPPESFAVQPDPVGAGT